LGSRMRRCCVTSRRCCATSLLSSGPELESPSWGGGGRAPKAGHERPLQCCRCWRHLRQRVRGPVRISGGADVVYGRHLGCAMTATRRHAGVERRRRAAPMAHAHVASDESESDESEHVGHVPTASPHRPPSSPSFGHPERRKLRFLCEDGGARWETGGDGVGTHGVAPADVGRISGGEWARMVGFWPIPGGSPQCF